MGNDKSKQQPTKEMDVDDVVIDLRMKAKQLEHASKKAEKESQQQVKKAKDALKKGNEEGAKLYLNNASMKTKESLNLLKTAHRLEAVTTQIKTNTNNIAMSEQLKQLTPMLQQQANLENVQSVNDTLQQYQTAMDKLTIAGNIMNSQMDAGMTDPTTDLNVEKMLTDLKMEVNSEINNQFMGMNQNFSYQNVNTNQNKAMENTHKSYN